VTRRTVSSRRGAAKVTRLLVSTSTRVCAARRRGRVQCIEGRARGKPYETRKMDAPVDECGKERLAGRGEVGEVRKGEAGVR